MTSIDPTELVLSIERDFPVTDWRYRDVDLWPLLRQQIWLQAFYADSEASVAPTSSGQLRRLVNGETRWLAARWSDRSHEASPRAVADVVLLSDGGVSRSSSADGHWQHRLADPVIDLLEQAGATTLQLDPHHDYRVPRQRPSRFVQPRLDRLQLASRARPASVDLSRWQELDALLAGRSLRVPPPGRTARFVDLAATWFEKLIVRSGARVALLIDWGPASLAFALAARRAGVVSVELQHGVHGLSHPHYGRWVALPSLGYSVHPDVYWTWQDLPELVPAWAGPGQPRKVLTGGNPWVEQALETVSERTGEDRPVVLVTLQPSLAGEAQLGPLLVAMQEAPDSWRWWFRHHPRATPAERAATEALLTRTGRTWESDRATSRPLAELLPDASVHVTVTSSTVREAHAFGIGSVVLGATEATELFADLIAGGQVISASTSRGVLAGVLQLHEQRRHAAAPSGKPAAAVQEILRLAGSRRQARPG